MLISARNIFLAYPCVPERYILVLHLMRLTSLLVLSAKYCDIDFYFSLHSSLYLGIATALVENHFNLPFEGSKALMFDLLML